MEQGGSVSDGFCFEILHSWWSGAGKLSAEKAGAHFQWKKRNSSENLRRDTQQYLENNIKSQTFFSN